MFRKNKVIKTENFLPLPHPTPPIQNINKASKSISQAKDPAKDVLNLHNQSRITHTRESQEFRMFNQLNEGQTQIQSSAFNFQPNILPERQNKIRSIKAQIHDSGATGTKDNSYEGFFHLRNTPKRVTT